MPPHPSGRSIESISPTPIVSSGINGTPKSTGRGTIKSDNTDEEGFALDTIRVGTDVPVLVPAPGQSTFYSSLGLSKRTVSPSRKSPSTPHFGNSTIKRMINGGVRPAALPRSIATSRPHFPDENLKTPEPHITRSSSRYFSPASEPSTIMPVAVAHPPPSLDNGGVGGVGPPLSRRHSAMRLETRNSSLSEKDANLRDALRQSRSQRPSATSEAETNFPRAGSSTEPTLPYVAVEIPSSRSLSSRDDVHPEAEERDRPLSPSSDISMRSNDSITNSPTTVEESSPIRENNVAALSLSPGQQTNQPEPIQLTPHQNLREQAHHPLVNGKAHDALSEVNNMGTASFPSRSRGAEMIDLTMSSPDASARSPQSREISFSQEDSPSNLRDTSITAMSVDGDKEKGIDTEETSQEKTWVSAQKNEVDYPNEELPSSNLAEIVTSKVQISRNPTSSEDGSVDFTLEPTFNAMTKRDGSHEALRERIGQQPFSVTEDVLEQLRQMDEGLGSNVDRFNHLANALIESDTRRQLSDADREGLRRYFQDRSNGTLDTTSQFKSLLGRFIIETEGGEVPLSEILKKPTPVSSAVMPESRLKARNSSPDNATVFRSPRSQRQTRQSTVNRNRYSVTNETSLQGPEAFSHGSESDLEDNEEENEEENVPDDGIAHFSGSPTNLELQVPKSNHLSYTPANSALLGSPDAWPKDGRNVNLKHIQAYYGLSQEQAKYFLTQDAVERAMDGIKQLKLKYEKPSVPSINTVRQACKYEEMYGTTPKDFISAYISVLSQLTEDVPQIQFNPKTRQQLKKDDVCGNAHSILLAATRYRNRLLGTITAATKRSPSTIGKNPSATHISDVDDASFRRNSQRLTSQESPTSSRQRPARTVDSQNIISSNSLFAESPMAIDSAHQTVTLPFRKDEAPSSDSGLTSSEKSARGYKPSELQSNSNRATPTAILLRNSHHNHREQSVPESTVSVISDVSFMQSDELPATTSTSLTTVMTCQKESDDFFGSANITGIVTKEQQVVRNSRRKQNKPTVAEGIATEMMSLVTYPARHKATQLRLARYASNSFLTKINEKREQKIRNAKELEQLEENHKEKVDEITRQMEKMRNKAAYHAENEVDFWNDEDLERSHRDGPSSSTSQLATIDWQKYQDLSEEKARLEGETHRTRTRLIQEGIRIDTERDNLIQLRLEIIDIEKSVDENETPQSEQQQQSTPSGNGSPNIGSGSELVRARSRTSFKIQDDPLVGLNRAEAGLALGNQLLGALGFGNLLSKQARDENEHGYCTRKRLAGIHGPTPEGSKRQRL